LLRIEEQAQLDKWYDKDRKRERIGGIRWDMWHALMAEEMKYVYTGFLSKTT
jgi:hypothetical protein